MIGNLVKHLVKAVVHKIVFVKCVSNFHLYISFLKLYPTHNFYMDKKESLFSVSYQCMLECKMCYMEQLSRSLHSCLFKASLSCCLLKLRLSRKLSILSDKLSISYFKLLIVGAGRLNRMSIYLSIKKTNTRYTQRRSTRLH